MESEEIARNVGHMFRVDEDVRPFYRECRKRVGRWKRLTTGLGRLLRSPGLFEDVIKVIARQISSGVPFVAVPALSIEA